MPTGERTQEEDLVAPEIGDALVEAFLEQGSDVMLEVLRGLIFVVGTECFVVLLLLLVADDDGRIAV